MHKLTIIVLTFCAVLAHGQDLTKINQMDSTTARRIVQMEPPKWGKAFVCDTARPWVDPRPKPLTLDSLVVLWDEYRAECYADSHIVKSSGGPRGYGGPTISRDSSGVEVLDYRGAYLVPAIMCYYSDVIHKEPTFSGFMDFIRRKAGAK